MTGTGYASADFGQWGGFVLALMFLLMFVGGCAGSTTCGIKIFRLQVLYQAARVQLKRLMQPNGVFIPYYNNRPIEEGVAASVMGFFFLFIVSFAILAMLLGLIGLDPVTALSGAATAIANVGPGAGRHHRSRRHLRAPCRTRPNGCFPPACCWAGWSSSPCWCS